MDKKVIIDLIKLEVLNQCSPEDTDALKFLKRNDENFPWKEYGDYQNLVAVLSIRPEKLVPRQSLRDEIINKAAKLKNIQIIETNSEGTKEKEEPKVNIFGKPENENQKSVVDKQETHIQNNNSEEIIEEIEITEPEEKKTAEKITNPLDNFILVKEPLLYKLDGSDEKTDEIIKDPELQLKNKLAGNKKETIEEYKKNNDKNSFEEIEEEILTDEKDESDEDEIEEIIISEENIDDSSDLKNKYEEKNSRIKPTKEINRSYRNSRSPLVLVIALILISVPVIFFVTSSSNENESSITKPEEVEKQLSKKPEKIEMVEEETQSSELQETEEVVVFETVNEITKNETTVKVKETKVNQIPPAPEPLFVEPKSLEIVEDQSKQDFSADITKTEPPKEVNNDIQEPAFFVAVEEMPQPIGGLEEIQKRVVYPRIASVSGTEGKVIIQAIVDEKGRVSEAEVIKGIGYGCDEAALKAVLETQFTPGKQRGKPVKVRVTIPIVFKK